MGYDEMAVIRRQTPPEITGTAYHVLCAMANYTTPLGYCWVTPTDLAADVRVTDRSVRRSQSAMVEAGELEVADWDELPAGFRKPKYHGLRTLYRLVRVRLANGLSTNPTPDISSEVGEDGGAQMSATPDTLSATPDAIVSRVEGIDKRENKETLRPEARTREEPDPDGKPVPISQIAATVREALGPKAGPADGE